MAGAIPQKQASANPRSAAGNHNPWLIALLVSMATFMEVLDTSIANVSLQHIAGGLAASQDESSWVLTSYLVSNAIILPVSGWLSLVIGRKRFYIGCVCLFGLSSLGCGLSTNLPMLIFFRVLQGLGGGGLGPSEQSILADTFPPEKRGQAFALYGIAVVVAPAIGPALGGWITDNYSWHWIFLINLPVCALSILLNHLFLDEPQAIKDEQQKAVKNGLKIDYLGAILVALGLGCLQVVLDKGQEDDWFHSDLIIVFTLVSVISLIFLVIWELNHKAPIVDLPLLKNRSFAASMIVMFVFGFVLLGSTQAIPQFLQNVMGYNATWAGLALMGGGFTTMAMMPLIGVLLKKVQPKYLIQFGLLMEAIACFHFSGFNTDVSFAHAAWGRVIQAIGLPFLFVPITASSYAGIPPEKRGNASALMNAMRNLGGSFGISLAITLVQRRGQFHSGRLSEKVLSGDSSTLDSIQTTYGSLQSFSAALRKQAVMLSYIDVFYLFAIISLLAITLTFLLKKVNENEAGE